MRILLIAALAVVCAAQSAVAGTVFNATQLFSSGGLLRQLKITNYEYLNDDASPLGELDVGDSLKGIFTVTTALNFGDPNIGLSGFEVTGIFEGVVLSVDPVAGGPLSWSDFTFGPSAAFGAAVGVAGAMVAFYEDFTPDFSIDTIAGGLTNASNGTLVLAIGAEPGAVFGTDYFWTSEGYSDIADNGVGANVTAFAASLQLLYNALPVAFAGNLTQVPTPGFTGLGYGLIQNEFTLQGNVQPNPFAVDGSEFPLQSQDPISFRGRLIPEPGSMVCWLGLSGLILARRRRNS